MRPDITDFLYFQIITVALGLVPLATAPKLPWSVFPRESGQSPNLSPVGLPNATQGNPLGQEGEWRSWDRGLVVVGQMLSTSNFIFHDACPAVDVEILRRMADILA